MGFISRVRVIRSLVFCVVFCRSLFVLFLFVIVLSVIPRFTDSDYPFGIFKLLSYPCKGHQRQPQKKREDHHNTTKQHVAPLELLQV